MRYIADPTRGLRVLQQLQSWQIHSRDEAHELAVREVKALEKTGHQVEEIRILLDAARAAAGDEWPWDLQIWGKDRATR